MTMNKRVIVDTSNVVWKSLLAGKDVENGVFVEHEGRKVLVNSHHFGYECAINYLLGVMEELEVAPKDMIFVNEGLLSKCRRKAIYSGYKEGRDKRPPQAKEQFVLCRDRLAETFLALGAQVVTQDGVESDDVIAFLARKLDGQKIILSEDGDLATLINDDVYLWRNGMLTRKNPYGEFQHRFIPVYKALCGDGDEYKGARLFGPKAFLELLVWAGDAGLAAIEGMLKRGTLHELEEDVAEFKPFRKVIDGAAHVYESYQCALLHDEWVGTKRQPLLITDGKPGPVKDPRLKKWENKGAADRTWFDAIHPPTYKTNKHHKVFDVEIIGHHAPVFLVCTHVVETGEHEAFWWHKYEHMDRLRKRIESGEHTWVSFNGNHFDAPLVSAALNGKDAHLLKQMAEDIIAENGKSWQMSERYDYENIEFDHIDLMEVSPGVKISLKTFAGRLHYKTLMDMPFEHNQDLTDEQLPVVEEYCFNDVGVTTELFGELHAEVELRKEMSDEHDIDLRSKSDAQVAEAILKKVADIRGKRAEQPTRATYTAPSFIQTESDVINDLKDRLERHSFRINPANGVIDTPAFLADPISLCSGKYRCGIGGLHSTHEHRVHAQASEDLLISDWDVASYYPNIMLKAGLTPRLAGGAGERFIAAYRDIYDKRMEAKRAGNKKIANALKISLNGTFGKLGSPYCSFYSPDLMLAVTLTGQLNLLTLIYDIEFNPEIRVLSANTDGITVAYPPKHRDRILRMIEENAKRTGFEYEETSYKSISFKDVNNYIAITTDGKAKRKGLYAESGLMKNPTMEVCSNLAVDYLKDGVHPKDQIAKYTDVRDFVAVRNVRGGGVQPTSSVEVDDWVLVEDHGNKFNIWMRQKDLDEGKSHWDQSGGGCMIRKSRPKPVIEYRGGVPFGRIARWYMTTENIPPITYVGSGNKVPKTDGAKLCMTLPDELPTDLDIDWYVNEAVSILADIGVKL